VLLKTRAGFSLIESIVALVVLSLVYTSIWGWFGTAVTSTKRIEQVLALPEVFSQFVVYIELEDLQKNQSGHYQIGQYDIYWQAVVDRASDGEVFRRQPEWIVTLFEIQGNILQNGNTVTDFNTKVLKQWADPNFVERPGF
jgi:prepilin-type N-terminal cleavage/methylation domain-containing protein